MERPAAPNQHQDPPPLVEAVRQLARSPRGRLRFMEPMSVGELLSFVKQSNGKTT